MDHRLKMSLTRVGDASREACAARLAAARQATGMDKTAFCKAAGVNLTAYLNAEAGRVYPSRDVMLYLYRSHRVDFNFIIHGDFAQLPSDVQDRLLDALANPEPKKGQTPD